MKKVFAVRAVRSTVKRYNAKHQLEDKDVLCKGSLIVAVDEAIIKMRGERVAVVNAAWQKLMGQNALGEDVNKKLATRRELRAECNSRWGGETEVFYMFAEKITYTWISNDYS